jgi:uncharacterized low-complexity protein
MNKDKFSCLTVASLLAGIASASPMNDANASNNPNIINLGTGSQLRAQLLGQNLAQTTASQPLMQLAEKSNEAKCGEGKCGEGKEEKASEAKCGEGEKASEAKCGEDKATEGDKASEAKCGEGKCGEGNS